MTLPDNLKENIVGYAIVAIGCFCAGWAASVAVRHQAELVTITMTEQQDFLDCGEKQLELELQVKATDELLAQCSGTAEISREIAGAAEQDVVELDPEILTIESSEFVYVSDTPSEIFAKAKGANDLQSLENFKRNYLGKRLRVKGPVSVMGSSQNSRLLFRFRPDETNIMGFAIDIELREGEVDKVSHISTGTVITAEGEIVSNTLGLKIFLVDGVVVQSK